jgi:hypothetical protein
MFGDGCEIVDNYKRKEGKYIRRLERDWKSR